LHLQRIDDRAIYGLTIAASLLLSAWSGYAQYIPNPDAMVYLRAAELFSAGRWNEGLAVYPWPLYSLGIASVMVVTGAQALIAAQLLNAIFDCATAVVFVALAQRLASDSAVQWVAGWAALLIVLHPRMMALRSGVIRDHGFHTFLLMSLYFVVSDRQHARLWKPVAVAGCVVVAALFRLEALYFGFVIAGFYLFDRSTSLAGRLAVIAGMVLGCALLIPGYINWTASPGRFFNFQPETLQAERVLQAIRDRSARLKEMLPDGRSTGVVAYIGITIAFVVDVALRALTIPIAVLAVFAFVPRRLLSDFSTRVVLWFAGWQLPLLVTFMALAFFLDWRYAVTLALVLSIPAAFTLAGIAGEWKAGVPRARVFFPVALLAVLIPWVLSVPWRSDLGYLRDAGHWIDKNLPAHARIVTNDGRIAYYSGRPYNSGIFVAHHVPGFAGMDYLVVEVRENSPPPYVTQEMQKSLVNTINGTRDRRVLIYKLR
jgi:hypothetical protein